MNASTGRSIRGGSLTASTSTLAPRTEKDEVSGDVELVSSGATTQDWTSIRSTALWTSTRASCCVEINRHRADPLTETTPSSMIFYFHTGESPNELRIALIRAQGLAIADKNLLSKGGLLGP